MTTEDLFAAVLSPDQMEKLRIALKVDEGKHFADALERIATAAVADYAEMMLGKQMPTRAAEVRERRLFHLVRYYYRDRIPKEAEVLSMFQLTESGATRLLRDVKVKYRPDLEKELTATVKATLESATAHGIDFRVVPRSDNILEELKQVVAAEAPEFDQISKVKNSAGVYSVPADTFRTLCDHYGVDSDTIGKKKARVGRRKN